MAVEDVLWFVQLRLLKTPRYSFTWEVGALKADYKKGTKGAKPRRAREKLRPWLRSTPTCHPPLGSHHIRYLLLTLPHIEAIVIRVY